MTTDSKTEISAYIAALTSTPNPAKNSGMSDQYANLRQPHAHVAKIDARITPLVDRLRKRLAEIPAADKQHGLKMTVINPLVSGVQRTKPPAWAVAAALRQLGWTRYRCYSDGTEPSATYWLEPDADIAAAKQAIRQGLKK
jgi:hypothetical protein